MIDRLSLLRNIGQFDSVSSGAAHQLRPLTLIYAENGRGKTTLSAVLRSLATGEATHINERSRLGSPHPPHVVVQDAGGSSNVFQNGTWNASKPDLHVFDDHFVDETLYSGLSIDADHRQEMHSVILGRQGVQLGRKLQECVEKIEEHNQLLRAKSAAIPVERRFGYSVDDFCDLPVDPEVDAKLEETQRLLEAAQNVASIERASLPVPLAIAYIDLAALESLLRTDLDDLDQAAVDRVRSHLKTLGRGGESWVGTGMEIVSRSATSEESSSCPFCAQDLFASPLFAAYRAFFGREYRTLESRVADAVDDAEQTHSRESMSRFEMALTENTRLHEYWQRYCRLPELPMDAPRVRDDWLDARDAILSELTQKVADVLTPRSISDANREAISRFNEHQETMAIYNRRVHEINEEIRLLKERTESAEQSSLRTDVSRLQAIKSRHSADIAPLCIAYQTAKAAKLQTEAEREQTKAALESHQNRVFPAFEAGINNYLQRLNAGFRLASIASSQTRGGATCNYSVVVNSVSVAMPGSSSSATGPQPSFRTVLSAGDRNTLALAFFFTSLDQDPNLVSSTVVIDDPMTSLDEHRARAHGNRI